MTIEERQNDPPGTIIQERNVLEFRYIKQNDSLWYGQSEACSFSGEQLASDIYKIIYRPIAVGDIITSEQAKTLSAGSITRVSSSWSDQHQLILDNGYYWYAGPNGGNGLGAQPLGSNGNDYVVIYINHSN